MHLTIMILQPTIYSHFGLEQPRQFTHNDKHMQVKTEKGPVVISAFSTFQPKAQNADLASVKTCTVYHLCKLLEVLKEE